MQVSYELDTLANNKVSELQAAIERLSISRSRVKYAQKFERLGFAGELVFKAEVELEKAATRLKILLS